jgi:hypothetical protein
LAVSVQHIRHRALAVVTAAALTAAAAGCSDVNDAEATTKPSASATGAPALPPATLLAGRAVLSQDAYYSAAYRFVPSDGSAAGTARVERTKSGFRLDLTQPADAARFERTTVVGQNAAGPFYCRLTAAGRACVPGGAVPPGELDPRLQHAFTDWLPKLADPTAAISVTVVSPPRGVTGTCFSVEGVAASLDPPVDPGLYCFDDVGRITALRLGVGLLTTVGLGSPPAEIALPAPVGGALPATAVPSPTPTPTPSTGTGSPPPVGKTSPGVGHSAQPR